MFCPRCGLGLEEGTRFCKSCGQEVALAPAGGAPIAGTPAPAGPYTAAAPASAALPFAGFWVRFAAYLIDTLILAIPFGIVIFALLGLGGMGMFARLPHPSPPDPDASRTLSAPIIMGFLFAYLFLIVLTWLYFAGMESSDRQATFGKSVMALRVTNLDGRRLSFGHATGRFFAKIVSAMIPFAIGYIMAAFTARKQALHDLIAGTLVLRK